MPTLFLKPFPAFPCSNLNLLTNFFPESEIHSQLKDRFEKLCVDLKDELRAECVFYNVFHQCAYDSVKFSLFIEQGECAFQIGYFVWGLNFWASRSSLSNKRIVRWSWEFLASLSLSSN